MAGWKRWAAIGAGLVVGVPALLCGASGAAGMLLPSQIALETQAHLDAEPEPLFDHLDDASGIIAWWSVAMAELGGTEEPPPMQIRHVEGTPARGEGCQVVFEASGMTMETWKILEVVPNEKVVYDIDFGIMRVERTLTLSSAKDGGTVVVWAETGEMSNPWMRTMGKLMGDPTDNFQGALEALDKAASD